MNAKMSVLNFCSMNLEPVLRDMVVDYYEAGLCQRCICRYLCGTENNRFFDFPFSLMVMPPFKKTCVVCLNLLEHYRLEHFLTKVNIEAIKRYDSLNFKVVLTFPHCVLIREHCMTLYAKTKYPAFYSRYNIVPLLKAWCRSMADILIHPTRKTACEDSNLIIRFYTGYLAEINELTRLRKLDPRWDNQNVMRRDDVLAALNRLKLAECDHFWGVPPRLPVANIHLEGIRMRHNPLYIGGRYLKFSRQLPQTPEQGYTSSVQDEIVRGFSKDRFAYDTVHFTPGGREGFNVRMLGSGRPFFLKVYNPRRTRIFPLEMMAFANRVKKGGCVQVFDLQVIPSNVAEKIRKAHVDRKSYMILCLVEKAENKDNYVEMINNMGIFTVSQSTPIRVLHKIRCFLTKESTIFSIKARSVDHPTDERINKMIEIQIDTQASLYLREFVHGDLNRTRPCLRDILDDDIDVIAVDVIDMDLDVPPKLNQ